MPRPGHEVELLAGGDEFVPALESAIALARHEVLIETYIFADDETGVRVARCLAGAARRGVRVQLVVDGFGTPALGPRVAGILAQAGIEWTTFGPERRRFWPDRRRLRRLHRKLAVVDSDVAFVGGINILDDRVDPAHGNLDAPRLDYAVRVRGPLVATARAAMQRLWWELAMLEHPLRAIRAARRRAAREEDLREPAASAGGMRAMLLLRDNLRHRRTIEREYLRAIGRARRDVLIANAYFFPGTRFRRALAKAVARGVRVRLFLQGRIEYVLPHFATQALYDALLAAGVEIVEYRPSFLHAKVAVADDWATVGSSNIDPFSLLLAREANVVVRDARFASRLRDRIEEAMRAGGVPVLRHDVRRRSWPVRLMNWVGFVALRLGVAISGAGARY